MWPDAFETHLGGRLMYIFPGNLKNSSSRTHLFLGSATLPCRQQPCLCDGLRRQILKINARGTERGSVYPGVSGSDLIRKASEARGKTATVSFIPTTGTLRRFTRSQPGLGTLGRTLRHNHIHFCSTNSELFLWSGKVWTQVSIFRPCDNRQRRRLNLLMGTNFRSSDSCVNNQRANHLSVG